MFQYLNEAQAIFSQKYCRPKGQYNLFMCAHSLIIAFECSYVQMFHIGYLVMLYIWLPHHTIPMYFTKLSIHINVYAR